MKWVFVVGLLAAFQLFLLTLSEDGDGDGISVTGGGDADDLVADLAAAPATDATEEEPPKPKTKEEKLKDEAKEKGWRVKSFDKEEEATYYLDRFKDGGDLVRYYIKISSKHYTIVHPPEGSCGQTVRNAEEVRKTYGTGSTFKYFRCAESAVEKKRKISQKKKLAEEKQRKKEAKAAKAAKAAAKKLKEEEEKKKKEAEEKRKKDEENMAEAAAQLAKKQEPTQQELEDTIARLENIDSRSIDDDLDLRDAKAKLEEIKQKSEL